ncbi:(d)CMP kinase [Amycolatopsis sp. WAC 01375]|uniref:(d)CMP kinase n=1 Tax=Amycolatopsis sp. WAC 01375 TaxID=2203194 RepID=UPI000F78E2FF|nr:(d)CMP kinase [Amycolatopsis sp. WAC 01375]RSM80535.1 (d)CMP kinase [Amycolatopsis sp. WAC 01375]
MHEPAPATVIAVDGPAAAGKTTTSLALAHAFELDYLESGKAFRVIAWEAAHRRLTVDDPHAITNLCDDLFAASDSGSVLASARYTPQVLRSAPVTALVPVVARMLGVRRHVTALIHQWAAQHPRCIIEGRDIGTAMFPSARVKFYLTATSAIRAERRVRQEPGQTYETVLQDVIRRDLADTTRTTAPLIPAPDAVEIDTSDLTVQQVIRRMTTICRSRAVDTATAATHPSNQTMSTAIHTGHETGESPT